MNQSRQKAKPPSANLADMSPAAMQRMLHELQVQRVGLELQNEELRRRQADLVDMQARYSDLYDQAPVGYVTLSKTGRILEANLTAAILLDVSRDELVTRPISQFIGHFYQDSFLRHCRKIFETGMPQKCELQMAKTDGTLFWAHHAAKVVRIAGGEEVCRVVLSDITSRKRIETALRIKNFVFDASITANSVADIEGVITEANDAFLRLWCYSNDEIIGKPIPHFLNDPNDAVAILTALKNTGQWEGEYAAKRKDGSTFIAHGLATAVRDEHAQLIGYQSAVLDVTKRKQAEQTLQDWNHTLEQRVAERTSELKLSRARFLQLAEATFEGIAIVEEGILMDGNPQLGAIHGYELAEMLGRPVADFIAPESRALVTKNMLDGHERTYEYVGLRKDGSTFPAESHSRMSEWQGKRTRVTAVRDLTAVKQTAARLRAKQTELEQAHRLALLSEVGAGIIHQIGQPLCAMGANLAVALARYRACESKTCGSLEILQDIETGVGSMRDSIIHLRTLAHPEHPVHDRIDLNEVLAGVLQLLRQEVDSHQILMTVEMDPKLPPVQGDAVQLSQVILNLARNAFDACANRTPERRTVVITTRPAEGGGVELSVRDTGTGITPEAMARMFTAFFTTKPEGLGIGLRLCQTITEAHGGRIGGSNNLEGIGATFRLVLPGYSASCDTKV